VKKFEYSSDESHRYVISVKDKCEISGNYFNRIKIHELTSA